ncbi:hypothetical protein C8A01DRAFT_39340 [Parachaetomium inaequale]|uniref:Mid2 domain-containing protein n=1 Tax=Parachaetomium inaequale TaxID=2588326 RepID=A0AAN6P9G7_9PEZI|nr:hypothetical protein C8A01DRAFT_39340 [Parachaetomium inaequale]
MARLDALACVLALQPLFPLVYSQFLTPLTERQVFRVGEVQKIQYRTKLTEYTIAIWQQALAGGAANLGPVVVRATNGPEKEFDWLVQLSGFDLDVSNVFFFWLKEGGLENVGSTQVQSMASAYFNVTDEPLPSTSSSTAFSSTITSSSSSSSTSSSSSSSTSSTLSTASPTAAANPLTATTNQGETTASNTSSESSEGGGLPVAAQAGIAVGAAIVGLTAIVCGILWFRYLRKQQRMLVKLQQQLYSQPPDAADMEMWKLQIPPGAAQNYPFGLGHDTRPAELG